MKRLTLLGLVALLAACSEETPLQPDAQQSAGALEAKRVGGVNENGLFWLTIAHHNDGESKLLSSTRADISGEVGGVARFATLVDEFRAASQCNENANSDKGKSDPKGPPEANGDWRDCMVMISAGDNILPGKELKISLDKGVPYYDGLALDLIDYEALAIGNHEFDQGPDVFANLISSFPITNATFISSNLDVSGEPSLAALEAQGRIASSVVVREQGRKIGIIGATYEELAIVTSPRNVVATEVVPAVQAEIDRLTADGVKIIILASHLQGLDEDRMVVPMLSGVDVAIAGGGDELLGNSWNSLFPDDVPAGPYPEWVMDADGKMVPLVTTTGGYRYLAKLVAGFNGKGELVTVKEEMSGPTRVAEVDGIGEDPEVKALVTDPVAAALETLNTTILATQEVDLDAIKANIRTDETNAANLVTDAFLWQATQLAPSFGEPVPDIVLMNGGGIRNDNIYAAGEFTLGESFDILPFGNTLVVMTVSRHKLKELLEHGLNQLPAADGRFPHIAGGVLTIDRSAAVGSRVVEVDLASAGTVISGGAVVPGPDIALTTLNFTANGGDGYPFDGTPFTQLGVTDQQSLEAWITGPLAGQITAAAYPVGGVGRLQDVP